MKGSNFIKELENLISDFLKEDVEEIINCCNDFLNKDVLVFSSTSILFKYRYKSYICKIYMCI